jgi:glutamate 5-kinase
MYGVSNAGTAGPDSIVHAETHQPLLSALSSIVEVVVRLRTQGHKVVLVTSGAIGVGLRRMNIPTKPKSLPGKQVSPRSMYFSIDSYRYQALTAIGQGRLIAMWDNLFSQLEQPVAQILLTRRDISDVCIPAWRGSEFLLSFSLADQVFECGEYFQGALVDGGCSHCE